MKKILSCFLLAFIMLSLHSQYLYLETGKLISSFKYKNSEGGSLSDLKGSNQNTLGAGFRMSLFQSPLHISLGVAHDKFGATSSDLELGNYSEWEAAFLGANLGVDYEFLQPRMNPSQHDKFSFSVKGIFGTDYLIKGKQKLNNQVYDLTGVEEFDNPVFFLKGGATFNYYITRSYVAYGQYIFGRSILFGNYNGQEQLRFITHNVNIGFSVSLFYNR